MPVAPVRAATQVDLELVLAVDASGSISDQEFALQMTGIAAAFRDAEVLEAIRSGPTASIGVSVAIWAESEGYKDATPWHVLDGPAAAETFARLVEAFPRRIEGSTGIGRGVLYSVRLIEYNDLTSPRQVIDVSGDGRETTFRYHSVPPSQARHAATAQGITVNGLAILSEEPDLAAYYRSEVIGGFGAFVMVAETIDDFGRAIREKLLREIEYRPVIGRLEFNPTNGIGWNLPTRASLIGTRSGPPTVRPTLIP